MCEYKDEHDCSDCPFITCNNHPKFYLALQCASSPKEPKQNQAESTR